MPHFDTNLLQPLLTMLCLVGVGLLCRIIGVVDDTSERQLAGLVMNVFVPVMLFTAGLSGDTTSLVKEGALVFLAGLVFPFVGYGVGALVAWALRLSEAQASVVRVSASLCNTAFVGIPVCSALWGAQGAVLAAVYDQAMNIPLLALTTLEYGRGRARSSWSSLLFGPLLWGLVLGVAANLAGLTLPAWLDRPLNMISAATLPLSLILVGSLAKPRQTSRGLVRPLVAFTSARLVFAPLAAYAIIWLFDLRGVGSGIMVLQTAMPASVLATVMAKEYGADYDLAASGALLSILFSVITLPLIATLITLRGT